MDLDPGAEKADNKERASEVSSKYVQISISPNSKRSRTQSASVRMEHVYSRSVFFQTITHWALGLKQQRAVIGPSHSHIKTHTAASTHKIKWEK